MDKRNCRYGQHVNIAFKSRLFTMHYILPLQCRRFKTWQKNSEQEKRYYLVILFVVFSSENNELEDHLIHACGGASDIPYILDVHVSILFSVSLRFSGTRTASTASAASWTRSRCACSCRWARGRRSRESWTSSTRGCLSGTRCGFISTDSILCFLFLSCYISPKKDFARIGDKFKMKFPKLDFHLTQIVLNPKQ